VIRKLLPLLAFALVQPAMAHAQGWDTTYCAELSNLYLRYLAYTGVGRPFLDMSALAAIGDCQAGNTAAGVPVLEKKLLGARFTLPKRD
jgi:hypothetical protein